MGTDGESWGLSTLVKVPLYRGGRGFVQTCHKVGHDDCKGGAEDVESWGLSRLGVTCRAAGRRQATMVALCHATLICIGRSCWR